MNRYIINLVREYGRRTAIACCLLVLTVGPPLVVLLIWSGILVRETAEFAIAGRNYKIARGGTLIGGLPLGISAEFLRARGMSYIEYTTVELFDFGVQVVSYSDELSSRQPVGTASSNVFGIRSVATESAYNGVVSRMLCIDIPNSRLFLISGAPTFVVLIGFGLWIIIRRCSRQVACEEFPRAERCKNCGYWLKLLSSARCPECGAIWAAGDSRNRRSPTVTTALD